MTARTPEAEALRGARGKRVLDVERDVRLVSRQSLVTARALDEARRYLQKAYEPPKPSGANGMQ